MKNRLWKRIGSLAMALVLVVGLITVTDTPTADASAKLQVAFSETFETGSTLNARSESDKAKVDASNETDTDGNHYMKANVKGNAGFLIGTMQIIPGQTYTFSYRIKLTGITQAEGKNPGAYVRVYYQEFYRMDGKEGGYTSEYKNDLGKTEVSNDWEQVSFTYTPKAGVNYVQFLIDNAHNGTVEFYLDDIALEYRPDEKNQVVNGSFDSRDGWYKKNSEDKFENVGEVGSEPVMEPKYEMNENFNNNTSSISYEIFKNANVSIEDGMVKVSGDTGGIDFKNIPVVAGKTYTISYKLKLAKEKLQTNAYVRTFKDGGTVDDNYLDGKLAFTSPQNEWFLATTTVTIPSDHNKMHFTIYNNNSTKDAVFYIDDLQIYSVEQKVEKITTVAYDSNGFEDTPIPAPSNCDWGGVTATEGVGVDGSKAIEITPNDDSAEYPTYCRLQAHYATDLLKLNEEYTVKFKLRGDSNVQWRVYYDEKWGSSNWDVFKSLFATEEWKEYSFKMTPTSNTEAWAQIGFQAKKSTGKLYIDDFQIVQEEEVLATTFTEGIGNCSSAGNALAMENMSEVFYPVTVKKGKEYFYSYTAKAEEGTDCTVTPKAGNNSIPDAQVLTSEAETITGTFIATSDANYLSLAKAGNGKIVIDDVVLYEKLPSNPTNHTTIQGGGYNMPKYAVNLISNGNLEDGDTGYQIAENTGKFAEGMMIIGDGKNTIDNSHGYLPSMNVEAGKTYTVSYYVWITEAENLKFDMFEQSSKTASGPSESKDWCDFGFPKWPWKLDGETVNTSLTENTYGWRKVEITWTAKETGSFRFGLKIYEGKGTVYIDDVAMWDNDIQTPAFEEITADFTCFNYWDGLENMMHFAPMNDGNVYQNPNKNTKFTGNVYIDDIAYEATYQWSNTTILLDFKDTTNLGKRLSKTEANKICIKAGTELVANGETGLKITNESTIWLQNVQGEWLAWTEEYKYTEDEKEKDKDANVQYQDMGAGVNSYTFTNNPDPTYQGVLVATGTTNVKLSGNDLSKDYLKTTEYLGDYSVMSTRNHVLFDYKVALYKRGNAHLDGELKVTEAVLDSRDLVAVKKAVTGLTGEHVLSRTKAADVDADGTVDENDAVIMRRVMANNIDIMTTTKGESALGQGVMPILGYDGPDNDNAARVKLGGEEDMITTEIYDMIAELGINTVIINADYCDSLDDWLQVSKPTLEYAQKRGMKAYLSDGTIINRSTNEAENFVGKVDANVMAQRSALYDGFGSFAGYFLFDEPLLYAAKDWVANDKKLQNRPTIDVYTKPLSALSQFANISGYMNFYPAKSSALSKTKDNSIASISGVDYDGYKDYIGKASELGVDTLPYDMYLRPNGKGEYDFLYSLKTTNFYENLAWMRKIANNEKKPFQTFVQVGTDFDGDYNTKTKQSNLTTKQEMFLEASAALAMGSKGINYYSLIAPTYFVDDETGTKVVDNYRAGLINVYGEFNVGEGNEVEEKNPDYNYYAAAKKINTFVAEVDHILMSSDSKGVVTNNETIKKFDEKDKELVIDANEAGVLNGVSVEYVTNNDKNNRYTLVGWFDYLGKDAYMIVNTSTKDTANITLTMDQSVSYDSYSMSGEKVTATDTTMTYTVPAGECVLVVTK